MRKKASQQHNYYFSNKLKRQLGQIASHPLTIVEAPSGFGKTTAIREYLKENLPQGACEYWYTCLGEPASMAWAGICELLSNVNTKVADDLKKLKMPTMDTLFYIASYLKNVRCQTETYLVVDNYQLANCDIPRELIGVFSMHGNPNLHMIFITQQLEVKQQVSIHNSNIHTIEAPAFFFDAVGTAGLFRMEGISLTDAEIEHVYRSTEGWVSAIRLQIINYKENGMFDHTADIEHLVETAIWNRLSSEEKDFLLSVSVIESFTTRQAAIMIGKDILPEAIRHLLKFNDFIRYIPDQQLYSMHGILRDYLLNRFHNDQPTEYQNLIFRKAGHACAVIAQYCPAAHFFYRTGDFDAILSLPFSLEYLDNHKDKYKPEFIEALVTECPEETLCNYPYTMLVFGYMTLMCGQLEAYRKICRMLQLTVQNGSHFSQDELRNINGEYTLLASMGEFNDISKMREGQEKAWGLLGKPTDMVKANTPWLFATPSALNMLWRKSGHLEHVMDQMDQGRTIYLNLAQGHGAGANYVMRAEAMLMCGEDDAAEILCHKALYNARSYQGVSICLCAELIFARIAILRGDTEGYFNALKNIRGYTNQYSDLSVLRMAEHCMSIISLVLEMKDHVAPWVYDMESIKKAVYAPIIPFAQILHLKLLLMERRYNAFYGICQLALDASRNPTGTIRYMMLEVYQLLLLAVAKRNNGESLEAQKYLREALDIALPDQIYLPFAQQACMADFLPELGTGSFSEARSAPVSQFSRGAAGSPAPPRRDAPNILRAPKDDAFADLIALCKRQQKGVSMIRKAILQEKSPLTPREREIAQLAKDRLSAREIADRLYISEMTVRATLRNVYSKLGIHSKTELCLKEF